MMMMMMMMIVVNKHLKSAIPLQSDDNDDDDDYGDHKSDNIFKKEIINFRLKDELQKMQYLYNDHISGVKIEVQKLYSIKVIIIIGISNIINNIVIIIIITIIVIIMNTIITVIISIMNTIIIMIKIPSISINIKTMISRKRSWTR